MKHAVYQACPCIHITNEEFSLFDKNKLKSPDQMLEILFDENTINTFYPESQK